MPEEHEESMPQEDAASEPTPSPESGAEAEVSGMAEESPMAEAPTASDPAEPGEPAPGGAAAFAMPDFQQAAIDSMPSELRMLSDVNLHVKIELGRTRMLVEDVLKLGSGSVIELDKLAGDPVDIYVNDRPVARGEVLVLNDNFCVRISEILESVAPTEKSA